MTETSRKVALGIIGGCLIALGLGMLALYFWILIWSRHRLVVGLSIPGAVLAIGIPSVLMTAGAMIARRAFRRP
jgi:hypothetical protein